MTGRITERINGDAAVASCAVMAENEPPLADRELTEDPFVMLCLTPALAYFLDETFGAFFDLFS